MTSWLLKGPVGHPKSAIKGVSWVKERGVWLVRLLDGGEMYFYKSYYSLEEAEAAAAQARKEKFPQQIGLMTNDYIVQEEVTTIILKRRDGTQYKCYIDTEDLELVASIGSWSYSGGANGYALSAVRRADAEHTTVRMHRVIMGHPPDHIIDHINIKPLDNRKANLRLATTSENMQNRSGPCSNNKLGELGVSWCTRDKVFIASVCIDGKQKNARFNSKEAATKAVKEARAKLQPFSKEGMERAQNNSLLHINEAA